MHYHYYHRCLNLLDELKERKCSLGENLVSVAETLNTLGLVHQHMSGDQDTAIRLHREALNIYYSQQKSQKILMEIAIILANIGSCFWIKAQYTESKYEFKKSLEFLENCDVPKATFCRYSVQRRLTYIDEIFSDVKKEISIKNVQQQSSK